MELSRNIVLPVRQLKETVHGIIDDSLMQELSELEAKMISSHFYLVVLGMFKRGKSTLINRLLEKDIAPVGVVPLTAIITLFEYATEEYAEVIFADGMKKRITTAEIDLYVTEENNPENKKEVRYVRIYDSIPLLRQMHLVDTPGLGSEYEHNTQTTLSFIPKTDAALFVISADTPVSRADLELLKQLQDSVPKIIYILNKADLLPAHELGKMEAYNKKAVASIAQDAEQRIRKDNPEWFTLSARPGHPYYGCIDQLRERLMSLADEEKKDILQQVTANRFKILLSEVKMQTRLQLDTLQMPLHELEEKQKHFRESLHLLQEQQNEFANLMKGRIMQLQQAIDKHVKECEKALNRQLYEQLIRHGQDAYDQMMKQGVQLFQDHLVSHIIKQFDETKESLEERTKLQFRELLDQYCSRSQSFLNELAVHLQSLLGIDYRQIIEQFDLDIYTAFYFEHGRGDKAIYLRPSLALQIIGGSYLKKRFMKKIYYSQHNLVIANTSGVIYDLQYKIQESFRKFNYDLQQHLKRLMTRIETVISDTLKHKIEKSLSIEKKIQDLQNALENIEKIEAETS